MKCYITYTDSTQGRSQISRNWKKTEEKKEKMKKLETKKIFNKTLFLKKWKEKLNDLEDRSPQLAKVRILVVQFKLWLMLRDMAEHVVVLNGRIFKLKASQAERKLGCQGALENPQLR